jgi:hypothetical protein
MPFGPACLSRLAGCTNTHSLESLSLAHWPLAIPGSWCPVTAFRLRAGYPMTNQPTGVAAVAAPVIR